MQRPIGGYDNIPGAPGNTYGNLAGNPFGVGGFNFNPLLAQASPGGQNIGNVGGMMGPLPDFTPMENFEGYGSPQPTQR